MKNNLLTSPRRFRLLLYLLMALAHCQLHGQAGRGRSWASPPFDSVLVASGNFGEPRPGHFHSGLDLKTGGEIGWPVYAAAEGYISRIRVSPGGFGKALYIDHPGNITSVYAHLHAFTGQAADSVEQLQSETLLFEQELFPIPGSMKIQKGQLIGYSGNSGSSYGPHLHYEYRHTKSQRPFDPSLMGVNVDDTIPPELTSLVIYSPGEFGGLFGSERLVIHPEDGIFPDTLVTGQESIFLGFSIYERANLSENPLGLKSALVLSNADTVFYSSIDSFLYSETRFVNSLSDPLLGDSLDSFFYIAARLPGNELNQVIANDNGFIKIVPGESKSIKVILTDRSDNQFTKDFVLKYNSNVGVQGLCFADDGWKVLRKKRFRKREGTLRVEFDRYSFYEDLRLRIKCMDHPAGITDAFDVGIPGLPVHKRFSIQIRSEHSGHRAGIICVSGKDTVWLGGEKQKNAFIAESRTFGIYSLAVDSVAPSVNEKELHTETDTVLDTDFVRISLEDDLSGIDKVVTYLNDMQVLNEFNSYRNETVVYLKAVEADRPLKLKVEITDNAGNTGKYDINVTRKP